MRRAAKRRLPRFVFDFVDGGAGCESALARNRRSLDMIRLLPRVLTGCTRRDPAVALLGRRHGLPFGVAPIGMANLVGAGTDLGLARAAAAAGLPYVLSTAATTAIEAIAQAAPGSWFQLYVGRDPPIVDDLLVRAQAAGITTLVVTVDVPAPGKRLRDLANGFRLPLRPTAGMAADLLRHPRWSLSLLRNGAPRFANLERYERASASASSLAELMAAQSSARLDWSLLDEIRGRWRGELLVKGVLHPDDAVRLLASGVDGIVVSNHGGRQLDAAPAPIEVLPLVRAAVGAAAPVIVDGGFRTGEDIARAIALGADLVLLGRPFLYAAAARGAQRGAAELIALLGDEFDRALAHLGCASIADLRKATVACESALAVRDPGTASPPARLRTING
ncbi:MAG: alpha-hydroxy-acid oxidizing protein [Burkholderiales bacterium]|nr:alpha-hydroxy-acid oxidizing protein [Burkholderiales bacterium]